MGVGMGGHCEWGVEGYREGNWKKGHFRGKKGKTTSGEGELDDGTSLLKEKDKPNGEENVITEGRGGGNSMRGQRGCWRQKKNLTGERGRRLFCQEGVE